MIWPCCFALANELGDAHGGRDSGRSRLINQLTPQNIVPSPGDYKNAYSCKELNPGESMVVNESAEESPTGVKRRFRLRRDAEDPKLYHVDLNLDIVTLLYDLSFGESYGKYAEARKKMAAQARHCFNKTSSQLRTRDGMRLKLNLLGNEYGEYRGFDVPKNRIEIVAHGRRANSTAWPETIDCPTIIHEVMHLLGLCDSYSERQLGVTPTLREAYQGEDQLDKRYSQFLYDCRTIEPADSIMHNQYAAMNITEWFDVKVCLKAEGGAVGPPQIHHVEKLPSDLMGTSCNSDGRTIKLSKNYIDEFIQIKGENLKAVYLAPSQTAQWSLYPAQMRFITQPHCTQANARLITCSKNAYRTHSLEGCESMPRFCRNGDHLE